MLNLEEPIFCHPNDRPIGSFKKGFEQVLMRLEFFAGAMERNASPTLSGTLTPP